MMLKVDAGRHQCRLARQEQQSRSARRPALRDGFARVRRRPRLRHRQPGRLALFQAGSGEELWKTYDAVTGKKADCGTAFIIPQGDRYVLFNDQGDLIFADLSPAGYKELDRAHILDPVGFARGRDVVWSHPAFADRCVFARNDQQLVCVSLAEEG